MKVLVYVFVLLVPLALNAQYFEFQSSQIDFGEVPTTKPDSSKVVIQNLTGQKAKFKIIKAPHPAYSVAKSAIEIPANGEEALWVRFDPDHNVYHNSELYLTAAQGKGGYAINLEGLGKYPNSYYSATQNKWGENLKSALANIVDNHNSLGYTYARDEMYASIYNENGQVEGVYTGRKASFTTRSGANSNQFNCEHTFPQSKFNQNEPERSDIHHLFPTDVEANSRRSNYMLSTVSNPNWQKGGSKAGSNKFEPRNEQKGASARAMFYFVIRYQDYNNFLSSHEDVLRTWSKEHPPDQEEQDRNDEIYQLQNNRNPFVDHPEFLERISSISGTASRPQTRQLIVPLDSVIFRTSKNSDSARFNFEVGNEGNEPISLSNWTVKGNGFDLLTKPNSIPPGQSVKIKVAHISTTQGISKTGQLNFSTNADQQQNVSLPIQVNEPISTTAKNENAKNQFTVYPNPANGEVYVKFPRVGDYELTFTNLSGQLVKQLTVKDSNHRIINFKPNGNNVLLLNIKEGNNNYKKRIFIAR